MSLIVESLVSSSNSQILDDLSFKPENNHESGKTIITNNILLQEQNHQTLEENNRKPIEENLKILNEIYDIKNFKKDRPIRIKKQKDLLERKEDIIPKLKLLKFKKTNKKIFLRKSHKKNVNITKGSEKTKQFIEPASKEIHSKEEETTNRKPFYHSYKGFATVIEYLSKFEWFNNASFQNKQLPIKFLTPICFWFITCYNYFPRCILTRNIENFIECSMTKIDRIVPETKIRLTKNLIKSTIRTFEDQTINDVNDFSVSMNSILAKGLDLFFNDNIQRMYEKRQYQKNNYSIEDDLFLIEIKKFMRNKIPEIYDIYQNMRLESLADSFQDSEEKNANKINESTKNLFTNDFDAITDEKNNDREISKGIKKILNEKTKILDETEENKKSNDLISTLEEDKTILEKNEEFHEKIKNNINNISLSNLINLYSQELCKQQKINSKMILQIQEKMENEKKIQNIFDVEECTYDDMLADLRYFTKEEINYLTLLENKQQNSHLNKDSPTKEKQEPIIALDDKIKVYNHSDDTVCQICNDGDYTEENLIVFCSKCNISVHQICYGILEIPHGDWICDLCKEIGPPGKFLKCPLCQEIGGAMKKSNFTCETSLFEHINPSFNQFLIKCQRYHSANKSINKQNYEEGEYMHQYEETDPTPFEVWVHITCALWLPETYFQDKLTYFMVRGLENIDTKKFSMFCQICQTENSGACVQCAKNKCQIGLHPECARRAKLNMEAKLTDKLNYFIYCEKHTPLKLKRLLENKEKKYQEEIIKFTRTIEKYYETYNSEHRIKCIQIAKTKKSFKKYFKKPRMERHKDTKLFFSMIKEHFNSNDENKHIIFLKKNEKIELENSPTYEILEINKPKNIITSIPKNDFFWKTFKYKTLEPAQTYKKYYSSLRKIGVNLFQSHSKLNESNRKTDKYNRKKIKEKIRTSKTKKPKILEDPNKIYCICRKPYKEGEKMMECDLCLEWFHFECIGFAGGIPEAENFIFHCPECAIKQKAVKKSSGNSSKKKSFDDKPETKVLKTPKSNYATPEKIKKKEKSTPNNENLPVCKRTRTHSVSSLVKISSSTPRKEKMLEEKKRNPIIKKEQKKDIKKKKNKDERSIVEQKKNRDIAEDLIGFLPKAKKIKK